ncbi:MAG: arylesterase [Gammaproteobacteria bacterium]|nr:arylesterase [Gammaproteobacteria bacterium]
MSRFFLSLLFLLLALPASASETAQPQTVLIVGDSLSAGYGLRPGEGWPTLLEARLADEFGPQDDPVEVVNASISGDTTRGALSRLPRALDVHQPDLVIIELGGNDGLRGFPLDVMESNLRQLIKLSRDAGADVLLLGMMLPPNYGQDYTEQFHQVYVDLAAELEVPLVEFFLQGVALNPALMQPDGIHPTAAAQPQLLENVWPAIRGLLQPAFETAAGEPVASH